MFRPFLPGGFAYGFAYGIPCSFSGGRHPAGLFVLYHIGAVLVNRFRQNFGGICLFPAPGGASVSGGGLLRRWRCPTGLNPSGTCSPCPGGEDHLKRRRRLRRIVPSPPVPPLLGCRHCSRESLSVGFTPYRRLPRRKENCMAGFISAASGSVQGCRGRSPRRNKL